jgi:hypothetical protein
MKALKHGVILLCLGLLAVVAIIEGLRTSDAAINSQQETTFHSQGSDFDHLRAEIGAPLLQARNLAQAGNYTEALRRVDGLNEVPNKTEWELNIIGQMRQYLLVKQSMSAAQPQIR